MKAAVRRLRRLEILFGVTTETMRNAVPSAAEMIIERLAAGEWQCALKLLELPEQDVWREWHSSVHRGTSPSRMLDIDFMDLTGLRQTLESSLADLPPEQRYDIARRLLAADTE